LATYGGIWQVFGDESPQIAKKVWTDTKTSICGNSKSICGFEKNGHFISKFGYLCAKIILFWGKLRR
jgi:hypothetical protein